MTVMHGDQRQRHHEKREREGEIAVVVERGDEHGREQRRQREAEPGRQDVDAPAVDGQRQRIRAVAACRPGAQAPRGGAAAEPRSGLLKAPERPRAAGGRPPARCRAARCDARPRTGKTACTCSGVTMVRPATSAQARAARSESDAGPRREADGEAGGAARMRDERLHVVEQRRGDVHLEHPVLQLVQGLDARYARERIHELAPVRAAQQLALRRRRRIAEVHAHEKAVELRLGQREGADLLLRVLRRDHEERLGQRHGLAVERHLPLLHRLEQRALRLGRGAVDLVGQHELREDRAALEAELAGLAVENRHAEHVRRQQIAGELHALERQAERAGEGVRERGLADARDVLDRADARAPAGTRGRAGSAPPCRE